MNDKINELIEYSINEYSLILMNWAKKKLNNNEDAEDLVQEVFTQLLRLFHKMDDVSQVENKLENYIWRVAKFTWFQYIKKNRFNNECVSMEADYEAVEDEKEHDVLYHERLQKMRYHISRLNYLHREVMIMFYIDRQSILSIAEKLNITEANVKWHLFDARNKVRKEIDMNNVTEYVYRPTKLKMGYSAKVDTYEMDIIKINDNLSKQNICIECYHSPKTIDDLSNALGLPKVYLENDLDWLVEREFLKKEKKHYSTMFIFIDDDMVLRAHKVFFDHKTKLFDKIIDELISKKDKIKNIRFSGSEKPMEKLLWFLIYSIIYKFTEKHCLNSARFWEDMPIGPDGNKYYPVGYKRSEQKLTIEHKLFEKYNDILTWQCENKKIVYQRNEFFKFVYGFYILDDSFNDTVFKTKQCEFLIKLIKQDQIIQDMSIDEKELLSSFIDNGLISLSEANKVNSPINVFVANQLKELFSIFFEIYENLLPEVTEFHNQLEKTVKESLPNQLKYLSDLATFRMFYTAAYFLTGVAYHDNKLYKPNDNKEATLLSAFVNIYYMEENMENVRIIEIPDCKMISTGIGNFGEGNFKVFEDFLNSLPKTIFPKDFLFWDEGTDGNAGMHWLYVYDDRMNVPKELNIIDFKGGLYTVVTGIDQQDPSEAFKKRDAFLIKHNLEIDKSRYGLGNVLCSSSKKIIGYEQMNYYTPIKVKE